MAVVVPIWVLPLFYRLRPLTFDAQAIWLLPFWLINEFIGTGQPDMQYHWRRQILLASKRCHVHVGRYLQCNRRRDMFYVLRRRRHWRAPR